MTGRELIIYILENGLENTDVSELIFDTPAFLTIHEAARKFDVGLATIHTWVQHGYLKAYVVNGGLKIPATAEVKGIVKDEN